MPGSGRRARRFRRRTVRVAVEYTADGETRRDTATTLGAGGLFVQTESPLAKGTPLEVRFRLPGGERMHEIAGRVAWSRCGEPGDAGMGIEFVNPHASSLLARELELPE